MFSKHYIQSIPSAPQHTLDSLIENRTTFEFEACAMHVFETKQEAFHVPLKLNHFALTSMVKGKKIMQLGEGERFEYLPGESVLVAPGEMMHIDFPEASAQTPTQCLALEISDEFIRQTVDMLNEKSAICDLHSEWEVNKQIFHLANSKPLSDTINRLLNLSLHEQASGKDLLVDLTLKELLIRLMQSQSRLFLTQHYKSFLTSNPLAHVLDYIKHHLDQDLSPAQLAKQACMSRTSFFRKFKDILGQTPTQFIMQSRLEAARSKLILKEESVTQVALACGFENISHFSRAFKEAFGLSPKAFQKSMKY